MNLKISLNNDRAITMIALIATIIILLILLGISIATIKGENGILNKAIESHFKSDIASMNEELTVYISGEKVKYSANREIFNPNLLYADYESSSYNGSALEGENIRTIISSFKRKYKDSIKIKNGVLKYVGDDFQEEIWFANLIEGLDSSIQISNVETTVENQNSIVLDNSTEHEVSNLKIYGASKQEGNPSPDNPIEVESLGEKNQNILPELKRLNNYTMLSIDNAIEVEKDIDYTLFIKKINNCTSWRIYFKLWDENENQIINNTGSSITDLKDYVYCKWKNDSGANRGSYFRNSDNMFLFDQDVTYTDNFSCSFSFKNNYYISMMIYGGDTNTNTEIVDAQFIGKYIDINVVGKNLFDKDGDSIFCGYFGSANLVGGNIMTTKTVYIKCKPNTTYTVSKVLSARFSVGCTTEEPANGVIISSNFISNNNVASITITTESTAKYLVAFIWNSNYDTNIDADTILSSIQIEENSIATAYEPYQGSITRINLKNYEPLRKVGDVSDYIDYKNGNIVRNIGKYTITGEEKWYLNTNYTDEQISTITCNDLLERLGTGQEIKSNYFSYYGRSTMINVGRTSLAKYLFLSFDRGKFTDLQNITIWLKKQYADNNPVTIYYQLATPIEEKINLPEIKALRGMTNITIESNVNPSKIECNYFKK